MITQKEMEENFDNLEMPGFPSIREIIEYAESGEDDRNALEYEKAYIALIEQVKDKPHDWQVAFLMEHIEDLRDMVTLFSSARDMYMFGRGKINHEILANLLIYRYENHISILDDMYCAKTKDFVDMVRNRINVKLGRERGLLQIKFSEEHPEEAKAIYEKKLQENIEVGKRLRKAGEEFWKTHTIQDVINYSGE
jgi:hypothetical protein